MDPSTNDATFLPLIWFNPGKCLSQLFYGHSLTMILISQTELDIPASPACVKLWLLCSPSLVSTIS